MSYTVAMTAESRLRTLFYRPAFAVSLWTCRDQAKAMASCFSGCSVQMLTQWRIVSILRRTPGSISSPMPMARAAVVLLGLKPTAISADLARKVEILAGASAPVA